MSEENIKNCPPEEDLIAWFDSELQDRSLEEHITDCDNCQKKVRTYHKIDAALQEELHIEHDIVLRIKENTLKEVGRPKIMSMKLWISLAACVAIVSTALFLKFQFQPADENSGAVIAETKTESIHKALSNTSFAPADTAVANDAALVEHSWKMNSRDRALTVLEELIPSQSTHFNKLKTEKGEFTLLLDMNKDDYQEMISVLKEEKFISEDSLELPENTESIRYKINFTAD